MQSQKLKSAVIRDFRTQTITKSKHIIDLLDPPFFKLLNAIFKRKPADVNFHITKDNTLAFKVIFDEAQSIFIEHFLDRDPSTLITYTFPKADFENGNDDLFFGDIELAV